MSTSENFTPLPEASEYSAEAVIAGRASAPNPDNPPWGMVNASLIWFGSLFLLLFVPLLFALPYIISLHRSDALSNAALMEDKTFILLNILGVIPAHILTFALVWVVATQFGKYPFWQTIGWGWGKNFGFAKSFGLTILMMIVGLTILKFFGGQETPMEKLINSSAYARLATAFLAATTGPLVEELVYRGILYSALQRIAGMVWAVIIVSFLFALVHVSQYHNNLGVIAVITILSVVLTLTRALTGKLLPSFTIHTIFNGIQALYLVFQPYIEKHDAGSEQKAAALLQLARSIKHFI